ncbi:MAG: hypothetical protein GPI92_17865 [Microcystis aeruginosa K13-06]|nr:hypothetical protein [Microcystis aeruginosa K13-06]
MTIYLSSSKVRPAYCLTAAIGTYQCDLLGFAQYCSVKPENALARGI